MSDPRTCDVEVDYLVIGAGASAMAFVDELVSGSDAEVLLVDRRHAPGGHWLDAYPFVRLHQPSAYYGVNSRQLGSDQVMTDGPEAGWYERASGAELVDYYRRVLDERFVPSGRVTFRRSTHYLGADGDRHVLRSVLTGSETRVMVRRRVVDASYVASSVPARHQPPFAAEAGTRVVTPNEVVNVVDAGGFAVIGAGKTAMDTCAWLLDAGVDADAISWIRPRDGWLMDRTFTQPYELSAAMIEYQSRIVEALAIGPGGHALAAHLEQHSTFQRIDPAHPADIWRGATIASWELERLRTIERVVRLGRVRHIGTDRVAMDDGEVLTTSSTVFVDCTAQGLATSPVRPIFETDRIVMQFTTLGVAPWSASIIGFVETLDLPDTERNRLCPPVPRTGLIVDYPSVLHAGFGAENERRADATIQEWAATARLNPGRSLPSLYGDPGVQASLARMLEHVEAATANLQRAVAPDVAAEVGA